MSRIVLLSKTAMVLVLGASLHLGTTPVAAASAQACFPSALTATKAALGSSKALSGLYNVYFGEALAKRALAHKDKEWSKLSPSERQNQLTHTKQKMFSYASTIAAYARSKFSWRGNKVTVTSVSNPDDVTNMTVIMSGNGCKIADVCIGKHCLSRMIGDGTKG
ncbi:MAG: hypothetical protein RLZZ234_635 [Candidatus Parcubacteria bacterium]